MKTMRPGYARIVNNCVDNLSPTHGAYVSANDPGRPLLKKWAGTSPKKRVVPLKKRPPKKALSHRVLLEESCALRDTPKSVGPQPPGAEGRSTCLRSLASSAGYGPTHLTTQKGMIPKKMGRYSPPQKKPGRPLHSSGRVTARPGQYDHGRIVLRFCPDFFRPVRRRKVGRKEMPPLENVWKRRRLSGKFGLPSGLQPGGKFREGSP